MLNWYGWINKKKTLLVLSYSSYFSKSSLEMKVQRLSTQIFIRKYLRASCFPLLTNLMEKLVSFSIWAFTHITKRTNICFNYHVITMLNRPTNYPDLNLTLRNISMRYNRANNEDEALVKAAWASISSQQSQDDRLRAKPHWSNKSCK